MIQWIIKESIWQGLNLPTEGRGHYLKKWTYHKTWIRLSSQNEVVVADCMPSGGVPASLNLPGFFPAFSTSPVTLLQHAPLSKWGWNRWEIEMRNARRGARPSPGSVCLSVCVDGWGSGWVCVHVHVSVWDSWALKRLKTELCTRVVCKIKHNVRIFPNSEASCWGCRLCWSGISLHSAIITQYSVSNDDMITGLF